MSKLRHDTVTSGERTYAGLVVALERRRTPTVVAGCLAVAAAVVTVALPMSQLKAYGIGVTFLLIALTVSLAMARRRTQLVLTTEELALVGAGGSMAVRWDDVTGTHHRRALGTPLLGVRSRTRPEIVGRAVEALDRMTHGRFGLEIPRDLVGVDAGRLEELIERCAADPAERRRIAAGGSPA